jgi:protein ImuB
MVVQCLDWPIVAAGVPLDVPAAVLHANRVVACSPAARAQDVLVGLRRREAQGRCPALVVLEHDPGLDARRFEPVLAAVEALTPRVELTMPGTCAFATRGPSRYFGGDEALARRVARDVTAALAGRGVVAVGVADGPFAARLAARRPRAMSAPVVVEAGGSAAFLAPLPVSVFERPELVDVLERLGLRTLGAVAALPEADLVARFGREGQGAHRLAAGLDERPPDARRPPPDLAVSLEIDPPAERVDTAAFVGKALADQLHERLAAEGLACTRVAIEAETEHLEHLERLWRHEGALSAAAIADRVRWQLDGWLNGNAAARPTGGISRLALVPDEVMPARGRQLGFWGGEAAAGERARRALTRVQALLGAEAVAMPELRGGRVLTEQVVLVPIEALGEGERPDDLAQGGASRGRGGGPWPGQVPTPSPAVVHPEPRPAEVIDAAGAAVWVTGRGLVSGAPARLSVAGGRWAEVAAWAGPWPLDQRWWDPDAHRRQARFQVLTSEGVAHLLSIEGGRWWVEAVYD